jgi:hypothetical protein
LNTHLAPPFAVGLIAFAFAPAARAEAPAGARADAPPAATAELPDPRPVPALRAFVHIDTDAPLALRRNAGRFGDIVCKDACDRVISFNATETFQIEGAFPPEPSFRLGDGADRFVLRVRGGSHAGWYAGFFATVAGGMMFLAPGILLIKGATGSDDMPLAKPATQQRLGALVGAGSALLGAGIPVFVVAQTRLEIKPEPSRGAASAQLTIHF